MPTRPRSFAGLHRATALLAAVLAAAVLLAACGGAASSPSPQPTPPDGATFLLRVTNVQALPPDATFSWTPQLVITIDGKVLQGGAVPAIFPGPLLQPISARQLSAKGWSEIVATARAAGLLSGARDFTGGNAVPGGITTRIQLVADGRLYDLTGPNMAPIQCVTTPCAPAPGTPEAFSGFVGALLDPQVIVGAAELGPNVAYVPDGYAVLVGPIPDDGGLAQPPIAWPFQAGFGEFGKPLTDGSGRRCGVLAGADAVAIRGAFAAATSITKWRDPVDGSFHGLQVRVLLPGDGDPCAGLV